uniref:glycosyltransferase family 2 protein n=1 Tax=Campylobacter fetus TaxID=196 RepID=UPI003AF9A3D7
MFSIVITTYNRSKLLKRCLDSIKNQTFNRYEVLILDDCSSDDTSEMVKEYTNDSKFKYIRISKNMGSGSLLQKFAFENNIMRYSWAIMICDDDFIDDNNMLLKISQLTKNNDVILCESGFNYGGIIVKSLNGSLNQNNKLIKCCLALKKDLNKKLDIFRKASKQAFEWPYPKIYNNANIGYTNDTHYIFSIHAGNRLKYLDIKTYITSIVGHAHRSVSNLHIKNDEFKQVLISNLNCEGNFLSSFDAFPANVVVEYLSRFIDQDNFYDILDKFATFMKDSFQPSFDETYHKLNSKLYTYEERNDIIKNSKTFMIYCQNEWGKQIKEQFIKQGLECLGFIDDANSMSCAEFLKSGLEPDFVFIATGKPKLMSDLINNLQPYKGKVLTLHEKDDSL